MNFGQALAALINGKPVTRSGWSRPNMQVALHPPTGRITHPFLSLQLGNGDFHVWTPESADLLSQDWQMVGGAAGQHEQVTQQRQQPTPV
jgi:hypothetical protein